MNKIMKSVLTFGILLIATFESLEAQQLKVPAPSPLQTIKQAVGLSDITIEYSRPGVKERSVFGDVVPFGKIWRTGANASTKITFGEDVKVSGNPVSAGTYAIYSIPNKDSWEIMIYKDVTLGGDVASYKTENELFRFKATPSAIAGKVETFTIGFADVKSNSTNIELTWEQTRISFPITIDIDDKIMKNIETSISKDNRPYFQAATYYYDTNRDLNKALEWVNKAAELNAKAYWIVHLQAKIYLKLNNKTAAIASAEKSMALAKEDMDDHYISLNEKLIAEAKKK